MSKAALDKHLYGKEADQIGADIHCAAGGGIKVTIDGEELPPLPHKPGSPWKIILMNMRPFMMNNAGHEKTDVVETGDVSDLEQGDFQIYYDALDVTGEKFSLWGPRSHKHSGRTDCNTPWVGRTSLEGLVSQ